jgi:hypothetical protein
MGDLLLVPRQGKEGAVLAHMPRPHWRQQDQDGQEAESLSVILEPGRMITVRALAGARG